MTAREQIIAILEEHGPLTSPEAGALLNLAESTARNTLRQMNKSTPRFKRQVYIVDWQRSAVEDQRAYLRPVWALGDKTNKKKPDALTGSEKQARIRGRKKGLANSVFALAAITGRRAKTTRIPDILKD